MIGRAIALVTLATLAACSSEPRSTAYFEAHREEAARIVGDCKAGAHRGRECVNAQAGVAAAARQLRMNAYQKNF